MQPYKICIVGGWCGNRMVMVADHISELLSMAGYPCQVKRHSVWDNFSQPPHSNLILQLLPAFTEAEIGCPVINIKPLLLDLDHPQTIEKVLKQVQSDYAP